MENITIEKMEIKRFNALLMRTIVGMLFMGVLMWETFCLDTGRKGFLYRAQNEAYKSGRPSTGVNGLLFSWLHCSAANGDAKRNV